MNVRRNLVASVYVVFLALFLNSCGGNGGGESFEVGDFVIEIEYSLLPGDVFPTFISHIFGGNDDMSWDFAEITISNTGSKDASLTVSTELTGYGETSVDQIEVASGKTATVKSNPSFNFDALFAVNTPLPGNAKTVIKAGGDILWEQTKSLQISSRNTMFFEVLEEEELISLIPLLCVFVTPHDKGKSIDMVLSAAADLMPTGSMIGYQEAVTPSEMIEVEGGYVVEEQVLLFKGDEISISIPSVYGGSADIDFFVMDATNMELWTDDKPAAMYVSGPGSTSGASFSFVANNDGVYHLVYWNSDINGATRTLNRVRSYSHVEIVTYQVGAIYSVLQDMGVSYVSTPADFFESAQHIKYPSETVTDKSGNCIDGAVLFASAIEALGMNAHIAVVPGHAFAAVDVWFDVPSVIAIETTLVGSDKTWLEAVEIGIDEWGQYAAEEELIDVRVQECREMGLLPAPM